MLARRMCRVLQTRLTAQFDLTNHAGDSLDNSPKTRASRSLFNVWGASEEDYASADRVTIDEDLPANCHSTVDPNYKTVML